MYGMFGVGNYKTDWDIHTLHSHNAQHYVLITHILLMNSTTPPTFHCGHFQKNIL